MSNIAHTIARVNNAGHAAMLAGRRTWQDNKPFADAVATFAKSYTTNPKGNRAWGPPSA